MDKRCATEMAKVSIGELKELGIDISNYENFGEAMRDEKKRKEITDKISDYARRQVIDNIIEETNEKFNKVLDLISAVCKEEAIKDKEIFSDRVENAVEGIIELSGALDKEIKFGSPLIFEATMVYKVGVDELLHKILACLRAVQMSSSLIDDVDMRETGVGAIKEKVLPLIKVMHKVIKQSQKELEDSKNKTHEELRKEHGNKNKIDMSKSIEIDMDEFRL